LIYIFYILCFLILLLKLKKLDVLNSVKIEIVLTYILKICLKLKHSSLKIKFRIKKCVRSGYPNKYPYYYRDFKFSIDLNSIFDISIIKKYLLNTIK